MTDRPGCVRLQQSGLTIPATCMTQPCLCDVRHPRLSYQCLTHTLRLGSSEGLGWGNLHAPRLLGKVGDSIWRESLSEFLWVQAVSLVTNEQAETQERIHLFLSISLPLNIHFCIQYIFFELLQAPGILLAKKILSPCSGF